MPDADAPTPAQLAPGAPCPCRSGETFGACCAPRLAGTEPAPTALALMRSRYTAYALGDAEYLLRSWHPSTRPATLALDAATSWRSLHIVDTVAGGADDDEGIVEFVARSRERGESVLLAERSRFRRDHGAWTYVDAL